MASFGNGLVAKCCGFTRPLLIFPAMIDIDPCFAVTLLWTDCGFSSLCRGGSTESLQDPLLCPLNELELYLASRQRTWAGYIPCIFLV